MAVGLLLALSLIVACAGGAPAIAPPAESTTADASRAIAEDASAADSSSASRADTTDATVDASALALSDASDDASPTASLDATLPPAITALDCTKVNASSPLEDRVRCSNVMSGPIGQQGKKETAIPCKPPPHAPGTPHTQYECMQVAGYLPLEVVARIVKQNRRRFDLCYEKGLERDPTLAGAIDVSFAVDRTGAVSMVRPYSATFADDAVVQCVVRAFYGLSFPEPVAGVAIIAYRFRFAPPPPHAQH